MSNFYIAEQIQALSLWMQSEASLLHLGLSLMCGCPVEPLEAVLQIPGIAVLGQIAISLKVGEVYFSILLVSFGISFPFPVSAPATLFEAIKTEA